MKSTLNGLLIHFMIVSMVLSHTKFVRGLEPFFLRKGVDLWISNGSKVSADKGYVRRVRNPPNLGSHVTNFAPHLALKLIVPGKLTFDEGPNSTARHRARGGKSTFLGANLGLFSFRRP